MRQVKNDFVDPIKNFPFLLGGTFIEASLRMALQVCRRRTFPFLLGGTFIEAAKKSEAVKVVAAFPFLLGGTFIEALRCKRGCCR